MTAGRIRSAIDGIASVAIAAAAVTLVWAIITERATHTIPSPVTEAAGENMEESGLTVAVHNTQTMRRPAATLAIVEFSDFECPFCRQHMTATLPRIKSDLVDAGTVAYAFKHFPLEQIHPQAIRAAGAAHCAAEQGKFWEMHDRLFEPQQSYAPALLLARVRGLKLNEPQFEACLERARQHVRQDIDDGRRVGVRSTPTFLLGDIRSDGIVTIRRRLTGVHSFETFKKLVEELLEGAGKRT